MTETVQPPRLTIDEIWRRIEDRDGWTLQDQKEIGDTFSIDETPMSAFTTALDDYCVTESEDRWLTAMGFEAKLLEDLRRSDECQALEKRFLWFVKNPPAWSALKASEQNRLLSFNLENLLQSEGYSYNGLLRILFSLRGRKIDSRFDEKLPDLLLDYLRQRGSADRGVSNALDWFKTFVPKLKPEQKQEAVDVLIGLIQRWLQFPAAKDFLEVIQDESHAAQNRQKAAEIYRMLFPSLGEKEIRKYYDRSMEILESEYVREACLIASLDLEWLASRLSIVEIADAGYHAFELCLKPAQKESKEVEQYVRTVINAFIQRLRKLKIEPKVIELRNLIRTAPPNIVWRWPEWRAYIFLVRALDPLLFRREVEYLNNWFLDSLGDSGDIARQLYLEILEFAPLEEQIKGLLLLNRLLLTNHASQHVRKRDYTTLATFLNLQKGRFNIESWRTKFLSRPDLDGARVYGSLLEALRKSSDPKAAETIEREALTLRLMMLGKRSPLETRQKILEFYKYLVPSFPKESSAFKSEMSILKKISETGTSEERLIALKAHHYLILQVQEAWASQIQKYRDMVSSDVIEPDLRLTALYLLYDMTSRLQLDEWIRTIVFSEKWMKDPKGTPQLQEASAKVVDALWKLLTKDGFYISNHITFLRDLLLNPNSGEKEVDIAKQIYSQYWFDKILAEGWKSYESRQVVKDELRELEEKLRKPPGTTLPPRGFSDIFHRLGGLYMVFVSQLSEDEEKEKEKGLQVFEDFLKDPWVYKDPKLMSLRATVAQWYTMLLSKVVKKIREERFQKLREALLNPELWLKIPTGSAVTSWIRTPEMRSEVRQTLLHSYKELFRNSSWRRFSVGEMTGWLDAEVLLKLHSDPQIANELPETFRKECQALYENTVESLAQQSLQYGTKDARTLLISSNEAWKTKIAQEVYKRAWLKMDRNLLKREMPLYRDLLQNPLAGLTLLPTAKIFFQHLAERYSGKELEEEAKELWKLSQQDLSQAIGIMAIAFQVLPKKFSELEIRLFANQFLDHFRDVNASRNSRLLSLKAYEGLLSRLSEAETSFGMETLLEGLEEEADSSVQVQILRTCDAILKQRFQEGLLRSLLSALKNVMERENPSLELLKVGFYFYRSELTHITPPEIEEAKILYIRLRDQQTLPPWIRNEAQKILASLEEETHRRGGAQKAKGSER